MKNIQELPRVQLGVFPTPFYRLERISETYGKNIWIKRDDMCGVALGGNKVRKLEFLLAEALEQGCDTVFTTGGAQSNHAMLTAACAARLGMRCILLLKRRGVTDHRGNLVLDDIFGAEVRMLDTDSYDDIYAEMHRMGEALERDGRKCCYIPVGGSTALGSLGYAAAVREFAVQALAAGVRIGHIVSATGSGGTTAGLLLGAKRFLPGVKVTGIAVDTDPFDEIVPRLAEEAAGLLEWPFRREKNDFEMVSHVGPGYAVPSPGPERGHPAGPGLHRQGLCRHDGAAAAGLFRGRRQPGVRPHRRCRRPVRHGPAPLSTRRFGRTIPLKEHH